MRSIADDWENGWQVFYNTSTSEQLLRNYESESQVTISADSSNKKLSFNSQGFLSNATAFTLTVGDPLKDNYNGRAMAIARSGQLEIVKFSKGVDGPDNNSGGGNG